MARRHRVAYLALALAIAVAGAAALASRGAGEASTKPSHVATFAWLHPRAVPATWSVLRLPGSSVRLPLPRGWSPAHGDAGTRTGELERSGKIVGYLNATPREGAETLGNWARFRPEHNRDEGDRDVRVLGSARGLRFPDGIGSCVLDAYLTGSGSRYRELACIVAGRSASAVIVAAAPPGRWRAEAAVLERAVSSFQT